MADKEMMHFVEAQVQISFMVAKVVMYLRVGPEMTEFSVVKVMI